MAQVDDCPSEVSVPRYVQYTSSALLRDPMPTSSIISKLRLSSVSWLRCRQHSSVTSIRSRTRGGAVLKRALNYLWNAAKTI